MTDASGSDSSLRGTAARRAQRQAGASGESGARPTPSAKDAASSPPDSASTRRTPTRRQLDPDLLVALEEERDFLLTSIADLEREHAAGDVDDADFASLNDAYTARAAEVLRAISDRRELVENSRSPRSMRRTLLTLSLVGLLALGAGWVVFRNAGTRAPGQGLTGDARQDSANLLLQAQSATGQASTALAAGDGAKALQLYEAAIKAYDRALELSPLNAEALTYRGWVLHTIAVNSDATQAKQLDVQAFQFLTQAIAADPKYSDARVFRAILERNAKQYAEAKADLDAVDMNAIPPYMTNMVSSVRTEVDAGLATSGSG